MMQLPLVGITKFLSRRQPGSSIGNLIFWLSFCVVGQPVAVLLYAIDYEFRKETGEPVVQLQANCKLSLWGECLLGEA
jgi:diacylglycerol O-acyltransferase-1